MVYPVHSLEVLIFSFVLLESLRKISADGFGKQVEIKETTLERADF